MIVLSETNIKFLTFNELMKFANLVAEDAPGLVTSYSHLSDLYKTPWDAYIHSIPYNRNQDQGLRDKLIEEILKKRPRPFRRYWLVKQITNRFIYINSLLGIYAD